MQNVHLFFFFVNPKIYLYTPLILRCYFGGVGERRAGRREEKVEISFRCKGKCWPEQLEHKTCHGWAFGLSWESARAFLPTTDQLINLIRYQNHGSALPGFCVRRASRAHGEPEPLSILHPMIQNSLNAQHLL